MRPPEAMYSSNYLSSGQYVQYGAAYPRSYQPYAGNQMQVHARPGEPAAYDDGRHAASSGRSGSFDGRSSYGSGGYSGQQPQPGGYPPQQRSGSLGNAYGRGEHYGHASSGHSSAREEHPPPREVHPPPRAGEREASSSRLGDAGARSFWAGTSLQREGPTPNTRMSHESLPSQHSAALGAQGLSTRMSHDQIPSTRMSHDSLPAREHMLPSPLAVSSTRVSMDHIPSSYGAPERSNQGSFRGGMTSNVDAGATSRPTLPSPNAQRDPGPFWGMPVNVDPATRPTPPSPNGHRSDSNAFRGLNTNADIPSARPSPPPLAQSGSFRGLTVNVDPGAPASRSPPTSGPPTPTAAGVDSDKERLRAMVESLNKVAERKAVELQSRSDELLDLQRHHEAFREKFIMFREGMRTKTDESDAHFRKLQADLKLAHEELQRRRDDVMSTAGVDVDSRKRILELEGQVERAQRAERRLEEELGQAREHARTNQAPPAQESVLADLRARVEKQAEFIRFQNARVEELEKAAALAKEDLEIKRLEADKLRGQALVYKQEQARTAGDLLRAQEQIKGLERREQEAATRSLHDSSAGESARRELGQMAREMDALRGQVRAAEARAHEPPAQPTVVQSAAERQLLEAVGRATRAEAERDQVRVEAQKKDRELAEFMASHAAHNGHGGGGELRARLVRSRDVLLQKLISHWQTHALAKGFAAWLHSIEAYKMDRILMESDKYMSVDSSIDDMLLDALSKRRARSTVASSTSLGSSIDDDTLHVHARRGSVGRSETSYGGSSVSGSLEWMV